MSTTKEKANEMCMNFLMNVFTMEIDYGMNKDMAKQCALIAVDEILENFGLRVNGKDHYCGKYTLEFYQEVRNEIEKL